MYISFSTEQGESVIATMVTMLEDAQCDWQLGLVDIVG